MTNTDTNSHQPATSAQIDSAPPVQKRRVKVLHVIPDLEIGGAEVVLSQLVSRLLSYGIESRILTLRPAGSLKNEVERHGTLVDELGAGSLALVPWKLMRYCFSQRKIWGPDIIQGWMYHANVASLLAKYCFGGARLFWNIRMAHTQLSTDKKISAWMIRLGARLSPFADAILYNSRRSAALHEQQLGFFSKRSHIIPNGFDTEIWAPSTGARVRLRADLALPPDALVVGMIARHHPFKNHSGFLEAAAHIRRELPNVHFVLVGSKVDGSNPELVRQISALGLAEYTHLLGSRRDIPDITAALDLAVSSSHMEGFPNAIGEAMSCGIPCVVTDVGDSALLVGSAGLVVPAGDTAALAEACVRLLTMSGSDRARLGTLARERIRAKYSLKSMVAAYADLYCTYAGVVPGVRNLV